MSRMLARKGLLAGAAVLGMISFALASPASADPVDDIEGLLTVGDEEFPVGEGDETGCGSNNLDVDFTGSASSGTWGASGTIVSPFQVSGSPDWFQANITLTGSGTYLPFAGSVLAQVVIHELDTGDCGKTQLCDAAALLIVDSTSAVTGGTLPNPTSVNLVASSGTAGGVNLVLLGECGVTIAGALGDNPQVDADLEIFF